MEEPNVILRQIAQRCRTHQVMAIAADGGGNGNVYDNLLLAELSSVSGLYAMIYSGSNQTPQQRMGRLWVWTIGRTASIGMVFTRIKTKRIDFPRLEDCRAFLPEQNNGQRTIKYTHPETQPDGKLHAINYAATQARRFWDGQRVYGN